MSQNLSKHDAFLKYLARLALFLQVFWLFKQFHFEQNFIHSRPRSTKEWAFVCCLYFGSFRCKVWYQGGFNLED
jgi:hypothetical protein